MTVMRTLRIKRNAATLVTLEPIDIKKKLKQENSIRSEKKNERECEGGKIRKCDDGLIVDTREQKMIFFLVPFVVT